MRLYYPILVCVLVQMMNFGDDVANESTLVNYEQVVKVAVLLSTYNGERFLCEQLDSLITQSFKDIVVHIRDDGSTDRTVNILNDYRARFPEIFQVYIGDNLGSSASFNWLLENIHADIYFFCDQDDIWSEKKVERHLACYLDLYKPEMVFSDLKILSHDESLIGCTLLRLEKKDPVYLIGSVTRLLCQNPVAGCAMSLNHAAKEQIFHLGKMPANVVHDHWFAIVTAIYGNIHYLPTPLINYRLHASNQIGSQAFDSKYVIKKLLKMRATLSYDLRLIKGLPEAKRPNLLQYALVKFISNVRRLL